MKDQFRSLLDAPVGHKHVAVVRVYSELEAERWVFYYFDDRHALTLDVYLHLRRPTKRHGWKAEQAYHRLASSRDISNMENPPLPDDVKYEAAQTFSKTLRVGMWKEFSR